MKTFLNTFSKTELRKLINWQLRGRGRVKRFSTFSSKYVIFEVITPVNKLVFNIDFCKIQSVGLKNGSLKTVYTMDTDQLPNILNLIRYYEEVNPKFKTVVNFPTINLKQKAIKNTIKHYTVNNNIFIDYMEAVNFCDKNKLSYNLILSTYKY